MENTKPKINVKRFSRSKVDLEDKPIEEPVVEKKSRGRKKKGKYCRRTNSRRTYC